MASSPDWLAIKQAVADALELPAGQRAAFLTRTCPDPELRAAAEQFLRSCEAAAADSNFLDQPVAEFAAPLVADVERQERTVLPGLQAALAGRYRIERELGSGGMATVYLAHDERHNRPVALKVVHSRLLQDEFQSGAARFQREIEIAARLTHPHILPLYDSGAAAGVLYYIMPYVEGESLRETLARTGPLPIDRTLRVLRDVARALAHAHRHGIVHRDIKPANILLNGDGDALVSDFGVAKALDAVAQSAGSARDAELSSTGLVLGTPAYIAPEQATGEPGVDHRADLYALGVVAYEMLAGQQPFAGRTAHQLLAAHLSETPEPIANRRRDVPPALASLIARLLAKVPDDRPTDASEVLNVLESAITNPGLRTIQSRQIHRRPGSLVWIGGAAMLVLAVLAIVMLRPRPDASTTSAATTVRSIAVLPFTNSSGNAEDEPFSDGLTDELIGALSKVSGLKVAARTSSFALKGKGLSARTMADTLGVTTLLEGTVRRAGDRLRITASLVDARDQNVLWSHTYDEQFRDIFTVQEQIARAIVDALATQLAGTRLPDHLVETGTDNLAAYQLYLRSRFLFNTRRREALHEALTYYQEAIRLDASYARAYAGLADAYNLLGILGYERPREVFPLGRAAAERAIALDSTVAEAHAALAHQLFVYEWNWKAAESAFQRALTLNPNSANTRLFYGIYLHVTGRHQESLQQLGMARTLDPLGINPAMIGRVYVNTGQPDSAIRYLSESIQLQPMSDLAHQQIGHAYLQKGMHQQAIASLRRAAELSGPRDSAQLAYVYAVAGQRAEAQRIVQRLLASANQRYIPPFHIAMAYSGLNDVNEAFRWLEVAFEERASFMDGLAVSTAFDPLRSDPRFAQLLRRMGLSQ